MQIFLKIIYNLLALPLLFIYSKLMSLANDKIKQREEMSNLFFDIPKKNNKRILIHASSMGEFEQVKYLIELIRKNEPRTEVIVSFFSPSGYNNLKNPLYYDYKVFLPLDFKGRVKKFVEHLNPDIVIFVRYDLWYNFVRKLHRSNIPIHLINATYTISKSLGKKFLGIKFYRLLLQRLTSIYCVNDYHEKKFKALGINVPIKIVPDTRYDRITSKVELAEKNDLLNIPKEKKVIVVGSCWKMDINLINDVSKKLKKKFDLVVIYVPHEVDENTLKLLKTTVKSYKLYSELRGKELLEQDLIVDKVGILLELYKYSDLAFVGGGFGKGVHSVTEPAGYGVPIFCGNLHYKNSEDARRLETFEGLIPVGKSKDLYSFMCILLENDKKRKEIGLKNKEYVYSLTGSSEIVYNDLIHIK